MFKWFTAFITFVFSLFSPGVPDENTAPQKDYIAVVASEAAYSALLPDKAPVKPKVPTKDCTTCKGTGRVRTGDDQGWTKCPDCDPTLGQTISR
jgi:hypothetical protein